MTMEELSARLERVERANRRMRAAGLAAMVLAAAGVAMGQAAPPPKVVKAESFQVWGIHGKMLAAFDIVGLTLFDKEGKRHAMFGLAPDGSPGLILYDNDGKLRADLGVLSDGSPRLVFKRGDGKEIERIPK